jgi:hypothetical protein
LFGIRRETGPASNAKTKTAADQGRHHQDIGRIVQFPVRQPSPRAAMNAGRRARMGLANLAGAAPVVLALSDDKPRALYLLLNKSRRSKTPRG